MKRLTIRMLVVAIVLTGCATTSGNRESANRAEIEGEPLPLDSRDSKYKDYFDSIRQMIRGKWSYPCLRQWFSRLCDYKTTELVIEFGILPDGRVPYVIVSEPSEFAIYNEYAVKAVKAAAPFPSIPEPLLGDRKGLRIRATFRYVVMPAGPNVLP